MISTAQCTSPGEVFTTDACLTGCGGVCNDQYFHAVFPLFVSEQNLAIGSLELLSIVVALKLWGTRWTGPRLTVSCDNEAAVSVLNTGRCRNSFVNSCLHEICYFSPRYEFEVRAVHTHVPGVSNQLADLLSRWDSCDSAAKERFLQRVRRYHWQAVPVPDAIFQFYGSF